MTPRNRLAGHMARTHACKHTHRGKKINTYRILGYQPQLITNIETAIYHRKLPSVSLKFINKTSWWDTHTHTCLGRAGAPPYHWNRAFQSESGTNSKSRHLTSIKFRFSLPPSPVRLPTLQVGAATRTVLSMGPGAGGGPIAKPGMAFLGCRGEWLGLDVTLGDLKQTARHEDCMPCL